MLIHGVWRVLSCETDFTSILHQDGDPPILAYPASRYDWSGPVQSIRSRVTARRYRSSLFLTKMTGKVLWSGPVRVNVKCDIEQTMDMDEPIAFHRGNDPTGIGGVTLAGINVACRIGNAICMPGDAVLGTRPVSCSSRRTRQMSVVSVRGEYSRERCSNSSESMRAPTVRTRWTQRGRTRSEPTSHSGAERARRRSSNILSGAARMAVMRKLMLVLGCRRRRGH